MESLILVGSNTFGKILWKKKIQEVGFKAMLLRECVLRLVETFWLVEAFIETIHGVFRNNRSINLLIRRGRASLSTIIGDFQLLVQNKLFSPLSCHFFCNTLQNPLLPVKFYHFVLKISEKLAKDCCYFC